jgi:hypothetical protein
MAIGTLLAKIILDEPRKIHYGSSDPVKGKVVLTYTPSTKTREESNPELFGPLQLQVTFHGRSKTKVYKQSGNNRQIFRGRAPLFALSKIIYDDSFRSRPNQSHSFPFQLYFPEGAPKNPVGKWDADGRFKYEAGSPLPPSFNNSYSGFAHRYDCFVEYRVGVNVAMPRLRVIVAKPEKYDEPLIHYERPKPHFTINERPAPRTGFESVKNEFLLPEEDRPTGFKARAKAAFSLDYYPTYAFAWFLNGPQHLYLGQPLVFEMSIRPSEKVCTAVLVPDVHLTSFQVEIRAVVDVRAERQLFSSPESSSDEEKLRLKGVLQDNKPFSKANDWTKAINTRDLRGVCSAFQSPNISLRYRMRVRGTFTFANKHKEFEKDYSVTIHPPIELGNASLWEASSSAAGGSSSQPLGLESLEATLPEYDRPPEYDEAIEEAPRPGVLPSEVTDKKEGQW